MKRIMIIVIAVSFIFVGCNNDRTRYGQGGENAIQFVKEQVPELSNDINKIEVIGEDSLLTDLGLTFASNRAASIKAAYYEGRASYDEMGRVLDSCKAELMVVEQSWKYGTVSKKIKKYKYQWRKVYTIRVTMKSGVTKEPRVLMDQDGITPRILENDFMLNLLNYNSYFTY